MYWKNKRILPLFLGTLFFSGCAAFQNGFLGIAPSGDRKDYTQARASYDEGNYEQAVKELTSYINKTKNVKRREARAYRLLGKSYEQLDLLDKALETYSEALEYHPDNVPLLVAAADLYQRTALLDRAQELYERALEEDSDNLEALSGLAYNYYLIGFFSKSRAIYDRFFALNPDASPLEQARYAQTFLDQRDYRNALTHITKVLEKQPDSPDFWFLRARASHGLNLMREALSDIDTALLLAPKRTDLLGTKALWLYQDKQYALSTQTAKEILSLYPKNQLAAFILALNLYKQGKVTAAKRQLQAVVQLNAESFTGKVAQEILWSFDENTTKNGK